jgi:hypothetical protein
MTLRMRGRLRRALLLTMAPLTAGVTLAALSITPASATNGTAQGFLPVVGSSPTRPTAFP